MCETHEKKIETSDDASLEGEASFEFLGENDQQLSQFRRGRETIYETSEIEILLVPISSAGLLNKSLPNAYIAQLKTKV